MWRNDLNASWRVFNISLWNPLVISDNLSKVSPKLSLKSHLIYFLAQNGQW